MGGLTKKRGISETPFKTIERETVIYKLTEAFKGVADALKNSGITGNEIGEITPSMLPECFCLCFDIDCLPAWNAFCSRTLWHRNCIRLYFPCGNYFRFVQKRSLQGTVL